jgi:hypothetical protein
MDKENMYICTMEYFSAIKNNEMSFAEKLVEPEIPCEAR